MEAILGEPARQRLLAVAADVLGRLAPEDTPPALRPIARFTPAKRVRLGGTALAAALDGDEEFRRRVADVVVEATPQLAEAVRDAAPTPASDPVDVAVVAYLLRPADWQRMVTEAGRAIAVAPAGGEQLTQLREQVAELKAQVRGHGARLKDAVAAAGAERAGEVAELRQRLRARTGELRAAEHAAQDAERRAEQASQRAEAAEAGREAETRRLRGRIAELERAVEAARRGSRAERDVDDARLWLLVDTLTQAAAGVRRELSLPAPTVRPGDTVASATTAAPRRSVDDPALLDRLLALPHAHLVVDGYNVTKSGYGELPLADQHKRLVAGLAALLAQSPTEVTVVFDGGARPPVLPAVPRGVRVLFSAPEEIADDVIRRLVAAEPAGRPVLVVTSDRQVQRDIQRDGGWAVPSAVLLARLG